MKLRRNSSVRALTLVEMLVAIAAMGVLLLVLVQWAGVSKRSPGIGCRNNLKQVGVAFQVWAGDHENKYPMQISITNGGAMEAVANGDPWLVFLVMSNELNTPRVLFCPTDIRRDFANSFTNGFSRSNLSYFVGLDASPSNRKMFLAGDRDISGGLKTPTGIRALTTNQSVFWPQELHSQPAGFLPQIFPRVAYGNILMADGATVQRLENRALNQVLQNTNHLAIP